MLRAVSVFVGSVLTLVGSYAVAATPDAGSILQQLQQEKRLSQPLPKFERKTQEEPALVDDPAALKVLLKKFTFVDNKNITTDELTEAFARYLDTEQTFNGLQKIARMVGEYYRGKGLWAKAVLPAQSLEGGELILQIIEGKLGEVEIEHKEEELNFPEDKSRQFLLEGQIEGEVFSIEAFQRAIKNLDAVPGVTAAAILRPGKQEGQTDVLVRMANTPATAGSVRIDNHGGRATSWEQMRLTGLLNIDSPFKLGEQINLQVVHSRGTDVFTAGFSHPWGTDGSRFGANKTFVRYELGEPLQAIEGKGDAQTTTVYLEKPLVQKNEAVLTSRFDLSHNEYYNETIAGVSSDKVADLLTATLTASWPDQYGGNATNSANVTFTAGDIDLGGAPANLTADASAAGTQGNFNKLSLQASRLQELNPTTQLWFSFLGQVSDKNLDSGQKMSLGGPSAIRAYPGGEGSGDHGALMTLELRHSIANDAQVMLYYDHGWTRQNHSTWSGWNSGSTTPNTYELKGLGVGLKIQAAQDTEVVALLASRLGQNPSADANGKDSDGTEYEPRAWFSIVKQF